MSNYECTTQRPNQRWTILQAAVPSRQPDAAAQQPQEAAGKQESADKEESAAKADASQPPEAAQKVESYQRKAYIKGIAQGAGVAELEALLTQCGEVVDLSVPEDRAANPPRHRVQALVIPIKRKVASLVQGDPPLISGEDCFRKW